MIGWPDAIGIGAAGSFALTGALAYAGLRRKGLDRWLLPYLRTSGSRRIPAPEEPVHLILAICDHYEPKRGGASPAKAKSRVEQWVREYPILFDEFRDSAGRPPQHTFFYPEDEYEPELVDEIAGLCRKGFGEVEIHLHHDNDTGEHLRSTLTSFKRTLEQRHGLLSKDPATGEPIYGFIHGNWALNNCRRDGRHCGVDNEIDILRETGCYADFTLPSSPSETQTSTINSLYWAEAKPGRSKSHDSGRPVQAGAEPANGLLMIQGPLLFDWKRRKFGLIPRIENSCLQNSQPPDENRLDLWLKARVTTPANPNWYFVKLHTHGVHEPNQKVLLGDPMVKFHRLLADRAVRNRNFHVHYVTAREMANLVLAPPSPLGPSDALKNSPYPTPFG